MVPFLKEGNGLLIAPEGTRSPSGKALPLKKGPFHLAIQSQASILPFVIEGAYIAKNKHSWLLTPTEIVVHIQKPIHITQTDTYETLRARTAHALNLETLLQASS